MAKEHKPCHKGPKGKGKKATGKKRTPREIIGRDYRPVC